MKLEINKKNLQYFKVVFVSEIFVVSVGVLRWNFINVQIFFEEN